LEAVAEVLSSLEKGNWLSFEDLKERCSTPEVQLGKILDFLARFDLLQYNIRKKIFRLSPKFDAFFAKTK
jgi:hypothetical protein